MRHNLADELKQTQEDIPHQRKMKIAATIWADESRISHRITPTSQKNNQATENQTKTGKLQHWIQRRNQLHILQDWGNGSSYKRLRSPK